MDTTTHNHTPQGATSAPTIDELRAASNRAYDAMNEARDLHIKAFGAEVREQYPTATCAELAIEPYEGAYISGIYDSEETELATATDDIARDLDEWARDICFFEGMSEGSIVVFFEVAQ